MARIVRVACLLLLVLAADAQQFNPYVAQHVSETLTNLLQPLITVTLQLYHQLARGVVLDDSPASLVAMRTLLEIPSIADYKANPSGPILTGTYLATETGRFLWYGFASFTTPISTPVWYFRYGACQRGATE